MLKQLNLSIFHVVFAIAIPLFSAVVLITSNSNQIVLKPLQRLMLACWIGYLLALLFATLESASIYSLVQWSILCAKFLFFIFLLFFINERFIVATLRIYANLMVVSVVLALIAVVSVVLGIQPIAIVDLGGRLGDVYFGTYYVHNTALCEPFPIYRIQGLSEEPATFAFSLLPAFFWLLIVEKAYVRSAVIVLGLTFSMSLGAGLLLLMLLPIVIWKYRTEYKVPVLFLTAICCIGLTFSLSGSCTERYLQDLDDVSLIRGALGGEVSAEYLADYAKKNKQEQEALRLECIRIIKSSISTSQLGKAQSFEDRRGGVGVAFEYLKDHAMGTGAALGMLTVKNSISVGYAVSALEAGVVGGVLYLCLFAIMGWLALSEIVTSKNESFEERVRVVVALTVGSVLVMGAQRIQPDLSLWHMWIYAMWFYLLQKNVTCD